MLEIIKKKEYELLTFPPFIEYIEKLEKENFVLLKDIADRDWRREIIFKNEKEFLKILILLQETDESCQISKYKEKYYKYMQTCFNLYTKDGIEVFKPVYSREIRHASYTIDGEYAKTLTSGFGYNGNEYVVDSGRIRKRKIAKEDLEKIITCGMNLQELTLRVEKLRAEKMLDFYECINEDKGEVRKLKLSYDE